MKMYGRSIYSFIVPREPLIAYTITFLQGWVDVNPECENGYVTRSVMLLFTL